MSVVFVAMQNELLMFVGSNCAEGRRPSLRANGSCERAPDDRLREAIQLVRERRLDRFLAFAPPQAAVIVRLDRTIQYARPLDLFPPPLEYWIPAFAGMTTESLARSYS
jgi:hypothetical protein